MKQKTTLKTFGLTWVLTLLAAPTLSAQQIYSSGGLSTGATSNSGVAAPTGYTWSEAQNDLGNTTESNTNAGFSAIYNNAGTISFALADDFVVPEGEEWNVTGFEFFGYQTGYAGTTIPIDGLRITIFDTDPSTVGATPIFGNPTANVLDAAGSGDAMMYRIFNSAVPAPGTAPGTTRKIWRFKGNLTATLSPGTYWVVYQVHMANDGGGFFPTITIPGTRLAPGANGMQNIIATTDTTATLGWADLIDSGSPASAPDVPQGMPFNVLGTILATDQQQAATLSLYPNPVDNAINITSAHSVTKVDVYDLSGRLVKSVKGDDITSIQVTELTSGTYTVTLKSNHGTVTKKIVKR